MDSETSANPALMSLATLARWGKTGEYGMDPGDELSFVVSEPLGLQGLAWRPTRACIASLHATGFPINFAFVKQIYWVHIFRVCVTVCCCFCSWSDTRFKTRSYGCCYHSRSDCLCWLAGGTCISASSLSVSRLLLAIIIIKPHLLSALQKASHL